MAVRVTINGADEFVVHESLDEFTHKIRSALDENQLLRVKNGSGRVRVINPQQVVYFEEVDPDAGVNIVDGKYAQRAD